MRRFYLDPDILATDHIEIRGAEARHMATVLRLRPGQTVEFFDGQGAVLTAILRTTDKHLVSAEIIERCREEQRDLVPLTLAQCLLKGKKMDLLVQKATELGVHSFLPIVSRYCENRGERDPLERWQRIMIEACKQCHRATPMTIMPVTPLDQADFSAFTHRLVAWEGEQAVPLPTAFIDSPGPLCLLLGSEGGLQAEEIESLMQQQFTPFSLGPRILRGETAALAATAIVQYLSGSLRPPLASSSSQPSS
jgi:16S rRNA (uracil1498-N3)-methyltransferase